MSARPVQRPASTSDARKRHAEREAALVAHLDELDAIDAAQAAETPEPAPLVPVCSLCGRERTLQDVNDYSPLQAITGAPLGWYSGDDGEVCPEDMEKTMRGHLA